MKKILLTTIIAFCAFCVQAQSESGKGTINAKQKSEANKNVSLTKAEMLDQLRSACKLCTLNNANASPVSSTKRQMTTPNNAPVLRSTPNDRFVTFEEVPVTTVFPSSLSPYNWTTVDMDGGTVWSDYSNFGVSGYANSFNVLSYSLIPSDRSVYLGSEPYEGDKCIMAMTNNTSEGPQNNDWLISPQMQLGGNSNFKFYVKSYSSQWGLEQYQIAVSTTDANPASFTVLGGVRSAPASWTEVVVDLSAYNGQQIYVAINYISDDIFAIFFDNLQINTDPITTGPPTNLTSSSVVLNGTCNATGTSGLNLSFEWGTTTAYGSVASATPSSVTGIADTPISYILSSGLVPTQTYHYRAVAKESDDSDTYYGEDKTFTVPCPSTVITSQPQSAAICPQDYYTLSVEATGYGLTYQWYHDGELLSDDVTTFCRANLPGTYHVVITNACSGQLSSASAVITHVTHPTISTQPQTASVCEGSDHKFTVEAVGNDLTYLWYFNDNLIIASGSKTLEIKNATLADYGNYKVMVVSSCGRTTSATAVLHVIEPLPNKLAFLEIPNPPYIGRQQKVKLSGWANVTRYDWSYEGTSEVTFAPQSGTKNETLVTFLTPGDGVLSVTMKHICGDRTAEASISARYPTSIENPDKNNVIVYPNPVQDVLMVQGAGYKVHEVTVTDMSGKVIYNAKPNAGSLDISVSGWMRGTYLVKVTSDAGTRVSKVVKK